MDSDWQKVPSVTTGGKPFFYVKDGATIMWDRDSRGWRIKQGKRESFLFRTPQEAKRVHRLNPNWDTH